MRSRRAQIGNQPLYARTLRLRHLAPSGLLCFVFLEGAMVLGILLALAELVSWWGVLVLPVTVALMVKFNDLIAGTLTQQQVASEVTTARASVLRPAAMTPAQAGPATGLAPAGVASAELAPVGAAPAIGVLSDPASAGQADFAPVARSGLVPPADGRPGFVPVSEDEAGFVPLSGARAGFVSVSEDEAGFVPVSGARAGFVSVTEGEAGFVPAGGARLSFAPVQRWAGAEEFGPGAATRADDGAGSLGGADAGYRQSPADSAAPRDECDEVAPTGGYPHSATAREEFPAPRAAGYDHFGAAGVGSVFRAGESGAVFGLSGTRYTPDAAAPVGLGREEGLTGGFADGGPARADEAGAFQRGGAARAHEPGAFQPGGAARAHDEAGAFQRGGAAWVHEVGAFERGHFVRDQHAVTGVGHSGLVQNEQGTGGLRHGGGETGGRGHEDDARGPGREGDAAGGFVDEVQGADGPARDGGAFGSGSSAFGGAGAGSGKAHDDDGHAVEQRGHSSGSAAGVHVVADHAKSGESGFPMANSQPRRPWSEQLDVRQQIARQSAARRYE